MPLPIEYILPKTKDANEFEDIICDVCIKKFGRNFQRYGRLGQKQFGVDILSMDTKELICVQCKNYMLSQNEIDNIINETMEFKYPISEYIIATSSDRDTKLQEYVMELNQKSTKNFCVSIMFWDEIATIISQNKDLLSKYYPATNKYSMEWLISEFNQLINSYDILGFVNIDPIVGMPKYYPELVDSFVFEIGQRLIQINNLQQHSIFVAINSFRDTIDNYNGYLSIKLFPSNTMYTLQNPYDLADICKESSEIKMNIYKFKKSLDELYSQINEGCSMFLVTQHI